MKRSWLTALCLSVAVAGLAPVANAQVPPDRSAARESQAQAQTTIEIPKDPLVAMYLSATLPGLGQIYAGKKIRGFVFMASVIGAFATAYASYEPALLELSDYDKAAFGGNADGLISTGEAQNWQESKYQDTAFDTLSDGRKAGVITGAIAGATMYLWNIFDARAQAHDHNRALRERRITMGLNAGPRRVGLTVGVNLAPSND
jgi:hypothetical protein